MFYRSIRFQLTAIYSVALFFVTCIVGCASYFAVKSLLLGKLDKALSVVAQSEADFASHTPKLHLHNIKNILPDEPDNGALKRYTQITNFKGNILVANHTLPLRIPLNPLYLEKNGKGEAQFENIVYKNHPYRMIYLPFQRGKYRFSLQTATPLKPLYETLNQLIFVYLIGGFFMVALASIIGAFIAGKVAKPLEQIVKIAKEINLNNLDTQIPVTLSQSNELTELIVVLNRLLNRLHTSVDILKEFTSNASHELKTPLTILKGEIQIALRHSRDNVYYQNLLNSNLEEVEHLISLSELLLDLAKAESQKTNTEKAILLSQIFSDLALKLQKLASSKNIALNFVNAQSVYVNISKVELSQVLYNLVTNAIDASQTGQRIKISAQYSDHKVTITVEDNGEGIPETEQTYIFERFYQLDKSRSKKKNSFGLGLAICKALIEKNKGTIQVKSQTGSGSVFTIVLPAFEIASYTQSPEQS